MVPLNEGLSGIDPLLVVRRNHTVQIMEEVLD